MCEWVMSRMRMVTYADESCHTVVPSYSALFWVLNASCYTCRCGMSRMQMNHITHTNESCHVCEWSHIQMSQVTHANESYNICEWLYMQMSRVTLTHPPSDVTSWRMLNESYHVCDMTRSRMWHDWMLKKSCHSTSLNQSCHIYVNESYHKCEWVMSRTSIFTHVNGSHHAVIPKYLLHRLLIDESRHICKWVMSHTWMRHVTDVNESLHILARVITSSQNTKIKPQKCGALLIECRALLAECKTLLAEYRALFMSRMWMSHFT